MGTRKRTLTTAAAALVCAVTVLGAPGIAYASQMKPFPGPSPSATSPSGSESSRSSAPVSNEEIEAVRKQLEKLYHDAAVATDRYNAAEEKAEKQSAEVVELAHEIARGKAKLAELKDLIGAAARAQYRGTGLPPEVKLWLSENPQEFLDGAGRVRQGQRASQGLLAERERTQEDLEQYAQDASARMKQLEANRKARAEAKKKITKQIAAAEELESQLEQEERERLAQLEKEAAQKAQTAWLGSGVLDDITGTASERGKKAVAFATKQIGKAYEWGAEGPKTYDCSGLTSQAWAAAGVPIPRTSQEQWKRLERIGIEDMRPGDLIIYNKDASHVALYVGDGMMVHAPRPGRTVTLAGAGTMPILGVVRPDTDA
ncbi:C40 family peptidase [Streptomyces poonensis]|uniref:Glycoside hydrolase n=1 Tax=Streptomyces poonensis TaxID=68255 RepID=A0A918PBG7_9ACTN|nr:C40 family peptidase [Streptomyces poonensis]GGY95864.1 glycoside hydrolase [Streptomyces poonensis]GLJ88877.1 glycoside hydrolase [Streptomyces poonensis]